ncbi:MAG: hypothetical protein BGP20_07605 [Thiobacillus sp. 63-78]|uniref:hypothetical protein n=1 Tax=Thiobacillus sp. 63-78 TaxID=1895859 RepID=UPI00086A2CDF|nr:hypothetical protein [Thiobacillus sp. 63-78]MBN8763755.1 hypothetical protein [Thiobacillus sp.]ODV10229.1 MAG: hypothetical protein ABT22_11960 [Thiobacillus sp. SCN 64-317]MBN8765651.1 hypothetical protein [Thiobacillus sp.]MBN8773363.1 hypothetical protein [Thiobacillus sp.]OJZ04202.1 MAG: hypothetical protein BGP20_07605 [Thiobacillus sp. 63-78]
MPYYVFRLGMFKVLEKQAEWPSFKEARAHVNALRKTLDPNTGDKYKMIFAENEIAAQETLTAERELDQRLTGDDW